VIYVTVGTHHQRFDRLLGALGPLSEIDELVVQHGPGPAPPEALVAVPFFSSGVALAYLQRARAVVMHAGVGSFLVARRAGHLPVLVPRLRRYGEHVDDHQAELARALDEAGEAIAVWDVSRLADAVLVAPPPRSRHELPTRALHAAVRHALDGDAMRPLLGSARTRFPSSRRPAGAGRAAG
jgi:beta-1,4-N-acetylglucosaminyltransferase